MVLRHGSVSQIFGHIAEGVERSARGTHLFRSSQTGSSFSLLAAIMTGSVASELSLRWASRLERDSRRLVNGGKMEVDATVAFTLSGGRRYGPTQPVEDKRSIALYVIYDSALIPP